MSEKQTKTVSELLAKIKRRDQESQSQKFYQLDSTQSYHGKNSKNSKKQNLKERKKTWLM